jgi:general secretion pathway protein F
MPLYHYRASDSAGKVVTGTLEAREERLVVQHLQQGGLIPLRISQKEEAAGWKAGLGRSRGPRVPLKEVVHFTQELAALLKAGLPLDRSLQALQDVTSRPAMKEILAQVHRDLQGGKTLSDSLARHRVFSSLYVSLIAAGETGGFLEDALERLGDYLKTVSDFRSYLISALIYPVILVVVACLLLTLMLLFVVPSFEDFFKQMGQNLYWSTQILLALSHGFRSYWWALGLLTALAVMIVVRLARSPQGQMTIDRFKMTAPFVGDLSRRVAAAFFAKTLGTLLNNGVPMVTSLKVVINSVANRFMARSLAGVLANVEKGQQLSVLLKKVGMFPELFLQMIAIGEETGNLGDMLLSAALSLENDARTAVQRLMALLEPVLILGTAVLVAFFIVSLMLPILNLYEIQF